MNRIFLYFFLFQLSTVLHAQLIVTNPAIPLHDQAVSITFDATLGNKGLLNFTGEVYAHTGVITDKSISGSDWKYVKATWTTNLPECKLTKIANNKYQLTIAPSIRQFYGVPASEKILKMAFVFRNPDGTLTGKDLDQKDIFAEVFESGLNVSFAKPADYFSLVQEHQTFDVSVNASGNDSISLFLDNSRVFSITGQSLSYTIMASGANIHTLITKAYKGTQTVSDTAIYLVPAPVQNVPVPNGLKDGIHYNDNQSATFVLFAPYKSYIYLIGSFNNWLPDNNFLMKKDGDRYWITLNGLTPAKEYLFQYLIDGNLRIADPYSEKISDPANDQYIPANIYPNLISYPTGKTTDIASVFQTGQIPYAWQATAFTPPAKEKLIVYELLIRDFTANHDIKTVSDTLSYLKRLGINAIEVMPFNEFEGNDSWGYNPSFYFAPDKAYGTKNDYKKFIDECHKKGIAVIQDLVLNHSYGQSPLVRMYFSDGKPSAQNPWYNQTSNIQNPGIQFGYDFNHNSLYTQKLIDSIASFWMSEYKIDGFRYDFTKGFSNTPYPPSSWASEYDTSRIRILKRMSNAVWKRNPNAYIIFEHLTDNQEEMELANTGIMLWGNMNYNYNQATMGYATEWDFSWISYKKRGWNNPNVMGYMESHDEERLMYKNLTYGNSLGGYSTKDLSTAIKRIELAANFFITVPGPKMIWQFGELGYDISINQGDRVGAKPIHWEYLNQPARKHLYDVYRTLIGLKEDYPVFTSSSYTMDATGPIKWMELTNDTHKVIVTGNFDVAVQTFALHFPLSGKWYEFYTGDSINVSDGSSTITLQPGEYRLYSDKKLKGAGSFTTDVKPITSEQNNIYPNPFSAVLHISHTEMLRKVELYDLTGKLILATPENFPDKVNTSSLPPGIYLLKMHDKTGKEETIKVVKTNSF
jgi:1,4-alpha-glucan branching enzyme